MPITITRKTTKTNIIRHLLLFVALICFIECQKKIDEQLEREITEILDRGDMIDLNCDIHFDHIISILNDEEIKKFNADTLIFKITVVIYLKITIHCIDFPKEKLNHILDVIICNITRKTENEHNNMVFKDTIPYLIGIYSTLKDNDFENFNKKIIPIAKKIISEEKNENEMKTIRECFIKFTILSGDDNFFYNLANNIELKELFITIVNEYTKKENNITEIENYKQLILNILEFPRFKMKDKFINQKNVYFKIIDSFLKCYIENIKNGIFMDDIKKIKLLYFFLDQLLKKDYYLKNITDFDNLTDIFNEIAEIERYIAKERFIIFNFTLEFYILSLNIINEKFDKITTNLEENLEQLIEIIRKFEINSENYQSYQINYNLIERYLCNLEISFEKKILKNIKKTFENYIEKIVLFKLEEINYNITEIYKYDYLKNFLSKDHQILEKYNLKKKINDDAKIKLEEYFNAPEDPKLSDKDIFFMEFVFVYDFVDISVKRTRELLLDLILRYDYKIYKYNYDVKDLEFFIFLIFSFGHIIENVKLHQNMTNYFFEKINLKNDIKYLEKQFIIKFMNVLKESKYKILKNLENLYNKEDFKKIMIELIENLKKLDKFYDNERKNYPEFVYEAYNNFKEIFYYDCNGEILNNNEKEKNKYWQETEIRKDIHMHFKKVFPSLNNEYEYENELETKQKKQRLDKSN